MIPITAIVACDVQTAGYRAEDQISVAVSIQITRNQQTSSRTLDDGWNLCFNSGGNLLAHIHPFVANIAPNTQLHYDPVVTCRYGRNEVEQPVVIVINELRRVVDFR